MIGDVFVTWMTHAPSTETRLPFGERAINRFGPNIGDRIIEEQMGRHESRHTDQWAVGTIVAGPTAFPIAYAADALLFPGARSHFERAASLEDGQYPIPPDYSPRPLWGPLSALGLAGALLTAVGTRRRRSKS